MRFILNRLWLAFVSLTHVILKTIVTLNLVYNFTLFHLLTYGIFFPIATLSKLIYQLFTGKPLAALKTLLAFPLQYVGYILLTPIMSFFILKNISEKFLSSFHEFSTCYSKLADLYDKIALSMLKDISKPQINLNTMITPIHDRTFFTEIFGLFPPRQGNILKEFVEPTIILAPINLGLNIVYPINNPYNNPPLNQNRQNHYHENSPGFQYSESEMEPLLDAALNRVPLSEDDIKELRKINNADVKTLLVSYPKLFKPECEITYEDFPREFDPDNKTYVLFKEYKQNNTWVPVPHSSRFYLQRAFTGAVDSNKCPFTSDALNAPPRYQGQETRYRWHPYFTENVPNIALSSELDWVTSELRKALEPAAEERNMTTFSPMG